MEICLEKQKLVAHKGLSFFFFFHGKSFTPTPFNLAFKINDTLGPLFSAFTMFGGRGQLSLTDQFGMLVNAGNIFNSN